VTFRALGADAVLALAAESHLEAIEWGADVHLPPGGTVLAASLARRCADAGIHTPSYGSYLLAAGLDLEPLDAVLDTAAALGAATVRVWTPFGTTSRASPSERARVAEALGTVAEEASARELLVALEYHPGTLTETAAATLMLLEAVGAPNLRTYWQPSTLVRDDAAHLAELRRVRDHVAHLHVFSWGPDGGSERLALHERASLWTSALPIAAGAPPLPGPRVAYLEFVAGDDPAALRRDAAALRQWLGGTEVSAS
jgi:sugar phosphate isomerase/epimerase